MNQQIFVPQTDEEATTAISMIGQAQRELQRIQADMTDQLAKIKEEFEEKAQQHKDTIKILESGVEAYCSVHRRRLTENDKTKTVSFPSGEVSWRMKPPKVGVRNEDVVVDALKKKGLTNFIRIKEEVNKEAISNDPDAVAGIKGITITQVEGFDIKPFEADLAGV